MKKLELGKDALILAILTLITVITWVGFDIYWALTKTEIPQILQKQIAPLDPKIPVATLEELQERGSFTQGELSEVVIPAPEEEELVEVGEELTEEIEEEATESGTVGTESGILEE